MLRINKECKWCTTDLVREDEQPETVKQKFCRHRKLKPVLLVQKYCREKVVAMKKHVHNI
jgi:hypothetical protein